MSVRDLLTGEAKPRGAASGWFAVESDHTVRGWARDKARPTERLVVAIAIDGKRVATALCDRFMPSLREQEESDGFSGFACLIPPAFRDGKDHEVEVEVASPDYRGTALKSKRAGFSIAPGTALPAAPLALIDGEGVEGALAGPNVRDELDLWLDGRRLPDDRVQIDWGWDERQFRPFRVHLAEDPLTLATRGLTLAYPGTIEAGERGSEAAALLGATVRPADGGDYQLSLVPGVALPSGTELAAEILAPARPGKPLATPRLRLEGQRARFALPGQPPGTALRLRLALPGGGAFGPEIAFTTAALPWRLLDNGGLARWDGAAPAGFTALPEGAAHGFHAFPPALKAQHGLSGHLLALPVPAGAGETVLLAHPLAPFGAGGQAAQLGLQLFARASRPVALALRLMGGRGEVARWSLEASSEWRHARGTVVVEGAPGPLRLELLATAGPGEPVLVEVAGVQAGAPEADGFADMGTAKAKAPKPGANLVRNAALTRWPAGLAFAVRSARAKLAEGWLLAGAAPDAGAHVSALPAPGEPGRYALALALPKVEQPCRLEVALDASAIDGPGRLRFAARLDGAHGQPWGFIDRITLVRRESLRSGETEASADTVMAQIARRVVLTRDWESFAFTFLPRPETEARFDADGSGRRTAEHLLRFELHHPIGLAIHGLDLRLGDPIAGAGEPAPALDFEDGAIRAQLGTLRGLEDWRSPVPLRPAPHAGQAPRVEPQPRRWSWRDAALGSVEVGIPVHDAADETLACLHSLVGATTVPHTVRVLDDGSGEDTRRRITAFVADKPWMRLEENGANHGYTATANRLVREAAAEWVILLNSDTIVTDGWIEGLLAAAADPRTAAVGPVSNAATYQSVPELYDGTGKWAVNPLPPGFGPEEMAAAVRAASAEAFPEVPLLNGFCTMFRRAAFAEVGGFDEAAFPAGYGEENDLCLRLRKAGWRLRVADQVFIFHAKSASFGHARRAELSKAGDRAFRALHADVDIAALGRDFLATPALAELRKAVRGAYPGPVPVRGEDG